MNEPQIYQWALVLCLGVISYFLTQLHRSFNKSLDELKCLHESLHTLHVTMIRDFVSKEELVQTKESIEDHCLAIVAHCKSLSRRQPCTEVK